jgi:uncharacterized Zn ribbon protein
VGEMKQMLRDIIVMKQMKNSGRASMSPTIKVGTKIHHIDIKAEEDMM